MARSSTTCTSVARSMAATRIHCSDSRARSMRRSCAPRPQQRSGRLEWAAASRCSANTSASASRSAARQSVCDCKICTLVDVLLRRWHGARHGWRTSWRKAADGSLYRPPPCTCFICSDPTRWVAYMAMSQSVHKMMRALLPCGKM
eukprot:7377631-Prymnesium_polylepis.1